MRERKKMDKDERQKQVKGVVTVLVAVILVGIIFAMYASVVYVGYWLLGYHTDYPAVIRFILSFLSVSFIFALLSRIRA